MMNSFSLHLQSATQYELVNDVVSFVGKDRSGSFGIMAGHARMMTCLEFGLMQFQRHGSEQEYLVVPGGVIYFSQNNLYLNTRRYLRVQNYQDVTEVLMRQLRDEEEEVHNIKASLNRLDEQVLKRLWEIEKM